MRMMDQNYRSQQNVTPWKEKDKNQDHCEYQVTQLNLHTVQFMGGWVFIHQSVCSPHRMYVFQLAVVSTHLVACVVSFSELALPLEYVRMMRQYLIAVTAQPLPRKILHVAVWVRFAWIEPCCCYYYVVCLLVDRFVIPFLCLQPCFMSQIATCCWSCREVDGSRKERETFVASTVIILVVDDDSS